MRGQVMDSLIIEGSLPTELVLFRKYCLCEFYSMIMFRLSFWLPRAQLLQSCQGFSHLFTALIPCLAHSFCLSLVKALIK